MDIRAISLATEALGASGGVAVPADTRAVLNDIASYSGLTEGERSALAQTVALADSGVSSGLRSQIISQVQGMGIYLRHTGDEGLPRWNMMSALRAYGLNLAPGTYSKGASESGVAGAVQQQLSEVAAGRGVTVDHALYVAKQVAYVAPPVAAKTAPVAAKVSAPATDTGRVEKIV